MTRKAKAIWFFMGLVFILFLYLIITSESIKPDNKPSEEETRQANIANLTAEYKVESGRILKSYLVLVEQTDVEGEDELIKIVSAEQVASIKAELLNLKVPAEFKNLHLDLVFAMTKMENYLTDNSFEEKIASQQLINQARVNHAWLR